MADHGPRHFPRNDRGNTFRLDGRPCGWVRPEDVPPNDLVYFSRVCGQLFDGMADLKKRLGARSRAEYLQMAYDCTAAVQLIAEREKLPLAEARDRLRQAFDFLTRTGPLPDFARLEGPEGGAGSG